MQVTETLNEGLKRELQVLVPVENLQTKLDEKLDSIKNRVRLNGFRPGKVPVQHLRKLYAKSLMAEIVNDILAESSSSILKDRGEKAALQPELDFPKDKDKVEAILNGEQDLEFKLSYEVLPSFKLKSIDNIEVERFIADISEEEINRQLDQLLASAQSYKKKKGKAAKGDRVTIDYIGKIDGEAFENGADKGAQLVLGSNQFIPGFEDQLIGVSAGDEKVIEVTFPSDYGASHLAGKQASFEIKVHEVSAADKSLDKEALAKKLGVESFSQLKDMVKQRLESQYGAVTRQKLKAQIFDQLAKDYDFAVPDGLLSTEFDTIWNQLKAELKAHNKTFEDEGTTEDAAREEYRTLAERRVRLGLVIAALGEQASVEVSEQDLQRALFDNLRRYPGQEKQMFDFFQKNPQAMASLRAPVIEEKVIDHLLTKIKILDKHVSPEELMREDESDTKPHKKPAKKSASKKTTTTSSKAISKSSTTTKAAEGGSAAKSKDSKAKAETQVKKPSVKKTTKAKT